MRMMSHSQHHFNYAKHLDLDTRIIFKSEYSFETECFFFHKNAMKMIKISGFVLVLWVISLTSVNIQLN